MHVRDRGCLLGLVLIWVATGCSFEDRAAFSQDADNKKSSAPANPKGVAAQSPPAASQAPAAGQPQHPANRLAGESSPYLLLHAHNPVDWRPWGPEAFEAARQQKKPIFLSVGYSSCFWCHVMERQVFENVEIAAYMNEHFINVKVDREERPDVDDIYMTALQIYFQAIGSPQGGGWPLSMFLTPDGKPFAGGTYFPPADMPGRPGFPHVLKTIHDLWTTRQKELEGSAELISTEVRRVMKPGLALQATPLARLLVDQSVAAVLEEYDPQHGGLDFNPDRPDAPKFPVPSRLMLLQSQAGRANGDKSIAAVDRTLETMAAGGIYDHLAGGFHRYSTDRRWLVPHFEKMLYDNAQLGEVYAAAFQRTSRQPYRRVAEGTLDFILREMTNADGGFHSALDAETDGVEGAYYVWSRDEVTKLLGPDDAKLFQAAYGIDQPEFFEHGYVLHLPRPLAETAEQLRIPEAELNARLAALRTKLLQARGRRKPLLEDDKVLTSWNGLMVRALAVSGKALNRPDYVAAAEKAAVFIATKLRDEQGRLLRTWRNGEGKLNAYLEDYAYLISGMLALHEATGDEKWLHAARRLMDDQIKLFWDEQDKGFYFTSHGHEQLIARVKDSYDSVLPSGNSASVRNLVRLAILTTDHRYREHARDTLQLFAPALVKSPGNMPYMALALQEYLDAFPEEKPATPPPPTNPGTNVAGGTTQPGTNAPGSPTPPVANRQSPLTPLVSQPRDDTAQHKARATIYLGADKLAPGGTVPVAVVLEIDDGWHLNANPPRPDYVIPVEISLASKLQTELTDIRYPAGKDFDFPGIDTPLLVYEGRAVIHAQLKVPAAVAGQTDELTFTIRYQACNDMICTRPLKVTLTVQAPVAATGATPAAINRDLFPGR